VVVVQLREVEAVQLRYQVDFQVSLLEVRPSRELFLQAVREVGLHRVRFRSAWPRGQIPIDTSLAKLMLGGPL
jgi:hypothetical protein